MTFIIFTSIDKGKKFELLNFALVLVLKSNKTKETQGIEHRFF